MIDSGVNLMIGTRPPSIEMGSQPRQGGSSRGVVEESEEQTSLDVV
jgi:hypothetical protein